MKSTRRANQWTWRQLLLLGAMVALFKSFAVAPVTPPVITSLAITGPNLNFTATFPPDAHEAMLEMRPTLETTWHEMAQLEIPAGGGNVAFTIPKPEFASAFFRLKVTTPTTTAAQLSTELQYVTMPPLGPITPNDSATADAVFHFKGAVDGSDRILITHQGAFWEHVNWDWPAGAVTINDTQWNPRAKNYLTTTGTNTFLPEAYSLETARLEFMAGRDVIALERTNGGLVVYLDDTQSGAAMYEFKIHFHLAATARESSVASPAATLKIAASIDGSDDLKITASEATWKHRAYSYPWAISLNDIPWNVRQTDVLMNSGTNTFLPDGVDFSTARIVSRQGRDVATMWAEADTLWIQFADNPNGADNYELEIAFGP